MSMLAGLVEVIDALAVRRPAYGEVGGNVAWMIAMGLKQRTRRRLLPVRAFLIQPAGVHNGLLEMEVARRIVRHGNARREVGLRRGRFRRREEDARAGRGPQRRADGDDGGIWLMDLAQ